MILHKGVFAVAGIIGAFNTAPAHHHQPHHAQHVHHAAHAVVHHHGHHPYHFYDSANPSGIPSHQAGAVYADGAYQASTQQTHRLGHTIWITVSGNTSASAIDVEQGCATPQQAAQWAAARTSHGEVARVYTSKSDWPTLKATVNSQVKPSERGRVHWWIADPTGTDHVVPGSSATQWSWNGNANDESTAKPGF